nr:MAG TPA: hypothetical protein [Caudoviricetes sp.]
MTRPVSFPVTSSLPYSFATLFFNFSKTSS